MIQLSEQQFEDLHKLELELLLEVDRICKKCNIKYTLYAGTVLGAVRHKGFIPWDDDADTAMLRQDYDKFCEVCEKELDSERFYLQYHKNTKGYRWGYAKLRRKNTLYLRQFQDHLPYEQGVSMDIFPMDNVPNNKILRDISNFKCFCIRKILYSPVGMKQAKSGLMRFVYKTIFSAFGERVFKMHEKHIEQTKKLNSDWVRVLTFPTATKHNGYKKKWFVETEPMTFENTTLVGMKHADEYLTFAYGDYMTPPEPKDRKVHPAVEVNFVVD